MIRNVTIRKRLKIATAMFFMATYILALLGEPVHLITHLEEQQVCTDIENACHIKLVHSDIENGCDHDAHFIEDNNFQCELCALNSSSKVASLDAKTSDKTLKTSLSHLVGYTNSLCSKTIYADSNRGPPANS